MSSWISVIHAILNGEAVDSTVSNRAILEVAERTEYLYDLIRAAAAGQSLIAKRLPVDPTVEVGDVVYYKKAVSKYNKAVAAIDTTGTTWFAAESAEVVGIVLYKDANNNADVLVSGSAPLVDYLTAAGKTLNDLMDIGAFGTGGVFYASASHAGKLTRSRSQVSALVGSIDASGRITINPTTIGSNRDHTHFEIDLSTDHAASLSDRGWIAANSTNFPGMTIPVGAVFGYNIDHADEDELQALFPPVPLSAAYITQTGVGLGADRISINEDNIWWMDSGSNPWDNLAALTTAASLKLYITKLNQTAGNTSVISVESLISDATRIPVQIIKSGAVSPGPNGGVVKLATAPFETNPTASEAATAVKDIVGKTKTVGPVVSRIKPGAGIRVVSANGDNANGFFGNCQIILEDTLSLLGSASVSLLNGAREDVVNGVHTLLLPKSKNTSIRYKMQLGPNSGGTKIKFVLHLFSPSGGNLPALNISYRQIKAPTLTVPGTIPASDTDAGTYSGHVGITLPANGHILSQSAQLPVSGNAESDDIFFVEISRLGTTDGFAYDVGILEAYYTFE